MKLSDTPDVYNLVLTQVANWITIVAGMIAIVGLLAAFLARPRVTVQTFGTGPSLIVSIENRGGRPARNISVGRALLNADDTSNAGDGEYPLATELHRRQLATVTLFEDGQVFYADDPRDREERIPVPAGGTALIPITWQSGIIPWKQTGQLVVWSTGREPVVKPWNGVARDYDRFFWSQGRGDVAPGSGAMIELVHKAKTMPRVSLAP